MSSALTVFRCMRCGLLMARAEMPQRCGWCGSIWAIEACADGKPHLHRHEGAAEACEAMAKEWIPTAFDRVFLGQLGIRSDG